MRIGQRLALRFTVVSALLTGAILIFIYMVTRGFVHADFEERLTQQSHFEVLQFATPNVKELIPPGSFLLPDAKTNIYSEEGILLDQQGRLSIPDTWINYLRTHNAFNAERNGYTTVGRKHTVGGKKFLVFVSDRDIHGEHELAILQKAIIIGWILSIALSYFIGLYFAGNAMQPVKHVVREVNHITKDNLSYRLKLEKDNTQLDEIDELITTFNALLNRIESAFIAQKRFVQNASHELRTPLTAIMAEAELALARDRSGQEYQRTLKVVVDETERLVQITQVLLTLARLEEGYFREQLMDTVSVPDLLNGVISTFKLHHPDRQIHLQQIDIVSDIRGNTQLLEIALLNLLDNAVKYSSGKISVSTDTTGEYSTIRIKDQGLGIPRNEISKVKTPLYRASNVNKVPGAGLGLSLVDRIVNVHNGTFELLSDEGNGTEVVMRLPKAT